MTSAPVPGPSTGPDDDYVPDYAPPAWYLANAPQGQVPWPASATAPPPAPLRECRVCGAAPVADVSIRSHRAFIVVMRWQRVDGPLCGLCGIALVRDHTTRTLWQGWWGIGSLIIGAPVALVSNLLAYRKLRRLQPTIPLHGPRQPPLGRPVLRRPLAYVALIPLIWAIALITHLITSGS